MADIIELARRKLAGQSADLVNKAGLPPLVVANLMFEAATAVSLTVLNIDSVAEAFRQHADSLDEIDENSGPLRRPGPFVC